MLMYSRIRKATGKVPYSCALLLFLRYVFRWAVALSTRSGPEYEYYPMGRETVLTTASWQKDQFPTFSPVHGIENGPLPRTNKNIDGTGYALSSSTPKCLT